MKRNVLIGICFLVFLLIAVSFFYLDIPLANFVNSIQNYFFYLFFLGITYLSSKIVVAFVISIIFFWKRHKRRWILPLWACIGSAGIISFVLKFVFQRARPFQLGLATLPRILQESSYSLWNFSFPSSHSMLVFCVVPILAKQFPKLKNIWITFAVLVAMSRVYFGFHFLSDVLAGGLIGLLIGFAIVKLEEKHKFGKKVYEKIFKK